MTGALSDRMAIAPPERRAAVLDLIGGAQERLILSLFRCDDFAVLDALDAALARGVAMDVLVTDRAKGGRKSRNQLSRLLTHSGATLHRYGDTVAKYHAKYMAADGRVALVGSANWTRKCLDKTCDFVLTTGDRGVVQAVERLFAADCAGRPLDADAGHERLLIAPELARERMAALLAGARRTIDIVDPKLTDPEMRGVLAKRRDAGVRITSHGGDVVGGRPAHGKLIVVDGDICVVGSLSLSAVHLGFRRELALVSTEPAVRRAANAFFASLNAPRRGRDGSRAQPRLGGAV